MRINSNKIWGFGLATATVIIGDENKSMECLILGPLVIGLK
jgi:hypothetical protein